MVLHFLSVLIGCLVVSGFLVANENTTKLANDESAIFSKFGYDGWYRLYSICEKNRTLRFALYITMCFCFCSQQYKLTDSLFSCANICYAHFEYALKRGFKKAFLYDIQCIIIFKYYIQVFTFPLSFENTFKIGFAHEYRLFS